VPAGHSYGCNGGKIVFATVIAGHRNDCASDPANLTLPASMRMARLALAAGVVTPGNARIHVVSTKAAGEGWQCGFDLDGL
jgi:hypothetical protein